MSELSGYKFKFLNSSDKSLLLYTREDNKCQFLFVGNFFSPLKKKLVLLGTDSELVLKKWENVTEDNCEECCLPNELKPYQYYWLRRKKNTDGEL